MNGLITIGFNIIFVLCHFQASPVSGFNAYIYYKNAQCTDTTTIYGTFVLSYDDEAYADYGYDMAYSGPCIYLDGGSWEIADDDSVYYDYETAFDAIKYGYCVECNGMAGCSYDGTCDTFMSEMPQAAYQMSEEAYASKMETTERSYTLASQIQQSTIKALESNTNADSSTRYVMLGAFIGLVALFGLLGVLEWTRKYRESKESEIVTNTMTQKLPVHDVVAV